MEHRPRGHLSPTPLQRRLETPRAVLHNELAALRCGDAEAPVTQRRGAGLGPHELIIEFWSSVVRVITEGSRTLAGPPHMFGCSGQRSHGWPG